MRTALLSLFLLINASLASAQYQPLFVENEDYNKNNVLSRSKPWLTNFDDSQTGVKFSNFYIRNRNGNRNSSIYLVGRYNLNESLTIVSSLQISDGSQLNFKHKKYPSDIAFGTLTTLGNVKGFLGYASEVQNINAKTWHAMATYEFNDHLTGMMNYSAINIGDINVTSVGLAYDVEDRVSITASATELTSISSRLRTYTLGVGLNF